MPPKGSSGSVEIRLVEVLKMIAESHGCRLLAARVHDGDHVYLFVSAKPKICIPELVGVLKLILIEFCLKSFQRLARSFGVGICGQMGMLLEALADDKEALITILKKMDWAKANLCGQPTS